MEEVWKDIKGYEGLYQISNLGRVKSLPRYLPNKYSFKTTYLKPALNVQGYFFVTLCKDGRMYRKRVNRLVAEAFIPNPDDLPQVNHKDENKLNNCVDNLEWCTAQYNVDYSKSKEVWQYTKDNKLVSKWKSINYAGRSTNIDIGNIHKSCIGERKSAGGYIWKYKEVKI